MSKTNYLRKRVLALLLALTMCLSLVQVTAFASEGEEQANVAITDTAEQDTDASAVEEDDENTSNVEETNGDISQEEGANEDISGEEESNEDTSDEKGLGEETSEEEEANEEASEEEESEEDASEEETPADDTLVCICETKCGEGSVKEDCPVCGAEDADLTACEGEEVPAEVPAQVQEFLDAVAALPAPEDIPEEATAEEIEALSAKIDACEATFNALSDENMEREDVQAALVIIGAVVNAFAGIQVLENSNTLEYPYEYTEGDITYELHEDGTATVTSGSATNGKIDIPATVTCEGIEHRVTAIGDKAFYQTSGSEFYAEITLPEGLEIIGEYAFNKVYLTNEVIHIPDSVTTIKKQAFCYFNDGANGAYVQKIVLGDGVRTIDSFAFYTSNTTQKLAVECGINIETFDKSAFYNKSPFNVSSVTVDGPKYSMDTVLKKVTALKPLVTAGTIQYTQGIDTNNINSITLLREAITTSEGPTTLTITGNIYSGKQSSIIIPAGKDITIQDDGQVARIEASYGLNQPLFVVELGGKLTLDGSQAQDQRQNLKLGLANNNEFSTGKASAVQVQGEFVLKNAEISGILINGGMTHGAIVVENGGRFIMTGGTIEGLTASRVGLTAAVVVGPGGEFDMSGGTIQGNRIESATTWVSGGVLLYTWNPNAPPAKMTLSGDAQISNNSSNGVGGGGITLVGDAELIMNGGHVTKNEASGGSNHNGGGICVAGPTQPMQVEKYDAKCVFTMNGGEISENRACYGGGLYVNSNYVTLNAGEIINNSADQTGGGVYVETPKTGPTAAVLKNALITGNTSWMGGGLYFCPTGTASLFVNDGAAVFDNTATGAADDLASLVVDQAGATYAALSQRMLGGALANWRKDGKISEITPGGWGTVTEDSVRYDTQNPGDTFVGTYYRSIALKSIASDAAQALARSNAELFITGNTATRGGGVGSNGSVIMGSDPNDPVEPSKEYSLKVTKVWDNVPESEQQPVTIQLLIDVDGQKYEMDTLELSKDNNWTDSFNNLPEIVIGKLSIKELTDGYITNYSDIVMEGAEMSVSVTNTLQYTVTVNYYLAGSTTPVPGSTPYTRELPAGMPYDVRTEATRAISGYTRSNATTGDMLTGTMDGNKVINVYYTRNPDQYTVTVNYYLEGTTTVLQDSHTETLPANTPYNVEAYDRIAINGYTYSRTTGNSLTGIMDGNKVINVYYTQTVTLYRYRIDHVYYRNDTVNEGSRTGDVQEIGSVPNIGLVTSNDYQRTYNNRNYGVPTVSISDGPVDGVYVITLRYNRTTTPTPGPDPDPDPTPTPTPTPTPIPDNPTPLNPGPDGTTIPDQDVPLAAPGLNSVDHYAYIIGYPDGLVHPEANVTRAEVATIFFRLMTDEFRTEHWATENAFLDVAAQEWFNNSVSTSSRAGIVKGYEDGSFRPNNNITRAEFAAIAARFLSDEVNISSSFSDISGHWAEEEINRAVMAGWIKGYTDGTFRPNQPITRAEAVTMINRMLDRTPDKDHMLENMIRWDDNTEDKWYYADMQEATNSHDYERLEMVLIEDWTELLENRDWAALQEEWATAASAPGGEVADNLDLSKTAKNDLAQDAEAAGSENA